VLCAGGAAVLVWKASASSHRELVSPEGVVFHDCVAGHMPEDIAIATMNLINRACRELARDPQSATARCVLGAPDGLPPDERFAAAARTCGAGGWMQ
jgi:hypothetical protein